MKALEKSEGWYRQLLEDLKKLEFAGVVLTKWYQGERLAQDQEKFGKPEYGSKRMENLAKDLDVSTRELYRCLQFYERDIWYGQYLDILEAGSKFDTKNGVIYKSFSRTHQRTKKSGL
jgi:hypothetical protein